MSTADGAADGVPPRRVAAFDFDGTLTRRDSLLPFLVAVRGRARVALAVALAAPWLAGAGLRLVDRGRAKEALLRRTLAGLEPAALGATIERFARDLVRTGLRDDTPATLAGHLGRGDLVVIVSAAPALYLESAGRLLGCDAVLATRLEVGPDGRLTGRLAGANCRGPEKVARLRAHLGAAAVELWAYGDSAGDRELLAAADHPTRV